MAPAGTPSHAVDLLMAMIVAEMFAGERRETPAPGIRSEGELDLPDVTDD